MIFVYILLKKGSGSNVKKTRREPVCPVLTSNDYSSNKKW